MFLPVGRTLGFLMGSPPGPGSTYPPFRACGHSTAQACKLKFQTEEKAEHDALATDCQHYRASTQTCVDVTAAQEVHQ